MRLNCMIQDGEMHLMGDSLELNLRPLDRMRALQPG
jgi:hypothetical protein